MNYEMTSADVLCRFHEELVQGGMPEDIILAIMPGAAGSLLMDGMVVKGDDQRRADGMVVKGDDQRRAS